MAELKSYTVTLANGQAVKVKAANPMQAQKLALELAAKPQAPAIAEQAGTPPADASGRYAGLIGRVGVEGAIEGVAGLPALAADGAYNAFALGDKIYTAASGSKRKPADFDMPVSSALTSASDGAADYFNLPEPQTDAERLMMAGGKAGIGALSGVGAMASLARLTSGGTRAALRGMAAGPLAQTVTSATGATALEKMMQDGADPRVAALTSLLYGVAAPTAGNAVRRATISATKPFRQGGRDQIVGEFLRNQSSDPDRAIQNLIATQEAVPGSIQTSGAASRDYGLMNVERGVRRDNAAPFAERSAQQNRARNDALRQAGGAETEESISALRAARTDKADEDTYNLFDRPEVQGVSVDTMPIWSRIAETVDSRTGARTPAKQAMDVVQRELQGVIDENGMVDPGRLYSVRQNLAGYRSGKIVDAASPNAKLAQNELKAFIGQIDEMLETAVPGYSSYMDDLRGSIKNIEAKDAGRAIYAKGAREVEPMFGEPILSLAGIKQQYNQVQGKLTAGQKATLQAVMKDMEQSQSINNPMLRQAGSDTAQNLSVANLLGTLIGGNAPDSALAQTLLRPFGWIAKNTDERMRERLTEAMLDPTVAAALMRKATPGNMEYASSILARSIAQAAAGTGATIRQTEADKNNANKRKPLMVNVYPQANP